MSTMLSAYRSRCDADYGMKLCLGNRNSFAFDSWKKQQQHQQLYANGLNWRTPFNSSLWPPKPSSASLHAPNLIMSQGPFWYPPQISSNNAAPSRSNAIEASALICNSIGNPQSHVSQAKVPPNSLSQSKKDAGLDVTHDTEDGKTSGSLTSLFNQLLHDNGNQITSSDAWTNQSESIGELAIKLADIALLENSSTKEDSQTIVVPAAKKVSDQFAEDHQINQNLFGGTKQRFSNTPLVTLKGKERHPLAAKKRVDGNIISPVDSQTKNFHPTSTRYVKSRGMPSQEKPVYQQRPSQGKASMPFLSSSRKINFRTGYNGMTSRLTCVSDSKSDSSSSSSNENCNPRHLSYGKSHPQQTDWKSRSSQEHQRRVHPRKSYSSCSSSSSGGKLKYTECVFCKTNGETAAIYRNHVLKDDYGRTVCEVLQRYVCPLCGATGTKAHTVKYCPYNENPPAIATMTTLKSMRSSTGRKRQGPCSYQLRQVPFGMNRHLLPA